MRLAPTRVSDAYDEACELTGTCNSLVGAPGVASLCGSRSFIAPARSSGGHDMESRLASRLHIAQSQEQRSRMLRITVVESNARAVTLRVEGRITGPWVEELRKTCNSHTGHDPVHLCLELDDVSFADAINDCRVPFAMFVYGIIAISYPVSLMGYHLFLAGRGETTREYLASFKFLPKERYRPFDHASIIKNWYLVLFRPRPPTYMRFNDPHVKDDPHFEEKPRGSRSNETDHIELGKATKE